MKKYLLTLVVATLFIANAANAAFKLGFGYDQGLGMTAQVDDFNIFVGNDGFAGDYILNRGSFSKDVPFNWYVGGGAFVGWDHGAGVRLPLGIKIPFNANLDGYVQVHPELDFDSGHDRSIRFGADMSFGIRHSF